jgi:hypothetical protein
MPGAIRKHFGRTTALFLKRPTKRMKPRSKAYLVRPATYCFKYELMPGETLASPARMFCPSWGACQDRSVLMTLE